MKVAGTLVVIAACLLSWMHYGGANAIPYVLIGAGGGVLFSFAGAAR